MQRRERGMTLVEVLVVTAILALISGAILVMFTSAANTYTKTVMRGIAQHEAAKVTERVRDVLRLSVEVDANKKDEIEFLLMPWDSATQTAKVEPQADQFGSRVHIYRGNDRGQKRADGRYLWLETREGPGPWSDPVKLTSHIEDLDVAYYYVEYDETDGDYIHIEIPEQGANRHERRRINAIRLKVTTAASRATTDPDLARPASVATAATTTIVLLPNATYMPGAKELLDPKNPNAAARPRDYLTGRGRTEVPGFIPLTDA